MNIPEDIYAIIWARLTGEITPEQELLLQSWLKESEQNRREFQECATLWHSVRWGRQRENVDRDRGWGQVVQTRRKRRRRLLLVRFLTAASVVLCVGLSLILWFQGTREQESGSAGDKYGVTLVLSTGDKVSVGDMRNRRIQEKGAVIHSDSSCLEYRQSEMAASETPVYNELIVPKCGEYRLRLADGSSVVMNADSKLRFPVKFAGSERKVYLEGEACFEVVTDTAHPFIVYTERAEVKVLGTLFNVSAYRGDGTTEVTLVNGAVQVGVGEVSHRLSPGKQLLLDNGTAEVVVREADALSRIAWIDGQFRFDAMPLRELMGRLARWYDISYEFRDKSLESVRFTGGVSRYDDIHDIIAMLGELTDVLFSMEGDKIIIDK